MNFKKQQLKGVEIHGDSQVGTRTVNILMGEHAGEYVRGDIMDANAVIQAFDELKGNVDTNHDTLEELVNEIHINTEGINNANTQIQKVDAESKVRDTELENSIAQEKTRAQNKEKEISDLLTIVNGDSSTDGSFRKAISDVIAAAPEDLDTLKEIADKLAGNDDLHTALNQAITEKADASALANEVTRATAAENNLKETLNTKYDSNNIPVASKELLGIAKVGDGLNVTDGTISVDTEYIVDIVSYGVEWDTTVADPTCTRIGNPLFHKSLPIQSQYKGCLVKNGVVNYYLDPNDWSKKADGTPSVLDGTDGDVMVHIPKFYGKSGSNGNKKWVRISTIKIDSSWVEIPEMFVSAYRITTYTDADKTKIASVVNTTANYRGGSNRSNKDQYLDTDKFRTDLGKPRTNVSRSTMRTNANNSGQELLCYEFYKWIFYWNYVIEYANFNSQKEFNSELTSDGYHQGGLGPGLTTFDGRKWGQHNGYYAITPCGYTNEFGNFSGVKAIQLKSTEKTLYANRWRGFENPFGDIWTNLEGIVIKRDTDKTNSNVYTTTDVSKYGDDYSLFDIAGVEIAENGSIKTFDLGSKAEIIPSSVGGSQSTYKCDYHYCNDNSVEKRILTVGGCAFNGSLAGLGFFDSQSGVGYAESTVGFRSLVRV